GLLKARFAPHPHLWMLVISVYFTLRLIALAGFIWALVQGLLGGSLWRLLLVPGSALAGGFIHGAVLIGEGLSVDQMYRLRSFLAAVLADLDREAQRQG